MLSSVLRPWYVTFLVQEGIPAVTVTRMDGDHPSRVLAVRYCDGDERFNGRMTRMDQYTLMATQAHIAC